MPMPYFRVIEPMKLDFTTTIPIRQLSFIKERMPDDYIQSPYLGVYYYGLNTTREPFSGQAWFCVKHFRDGHRSRDYYRKNCRVRVNCLLTVGCQRCKGITQQQPEWATWTRAERHAEAIQLYEEAGYGPRQSAGSRNSLQHFAGS